MSDNHPPYYLRKLSIAISLGHDQKINIQNREHPWYPVWDLVLNRYFLTTALHIGPQWPLWRSQIPGQVNQDEEAEESEISSSLQQQHDLQRTILAREAANQNDDNSSANTDRSRAAAIADDDDDSGITSNEVSQGDSHNNDDDDGKAVHIRVVSRIQNISSSRHSREKQVAASSSVAKSHHIIPDHRSLEPGTRIDSSPLSSLSSSSANDSDELSAHLSRTAVKGKRRIRTKKHPYGHATANQIEALQSPPPPQSHGVAYSVLSDAEQATSSHSATRKGTEESMKFQSKKQPSVPTTVGERLVQDRISDEEGSETDPTADDIAPVKIKASTHNEKRPTRVIVQRHRHETSSEARLAGAVNEELSDSPPSSSEATISWKDSNRIPDFVLLRVIVIGTVPVKDLVQQTAHLESAEVVLLMEIKRLLTTEISEITRHLADARKHLRIQAAYVFSRSSSSKTSVRAVAVAGHYFQFATIKRNPSKPRSTLSQIADPTWAPTGRVKEALIPGEVWTQFVDIGSKEAFEMWNKLRRDLVAG